MKDMTLIMITIVNIIITIANLTIIGIILSRDSSEKIKPYDGVGSGVLKSGTVIDGVYTGPDSIVGDINRPGVWTIVK